MANNTLNEQPQTRWWILVLVAMIVATVAVPAGVMAYKDRAAVKIMKMGGEIDVSDAPHGVDLMTMGGDIDVKRVDEFAKAKTMGGNITIHRANAAVEATTMAGNIDVQVIGTSRGHRDIDLSSNQGNITLTVPKDFPMQVHISVATTDNQSKTFRIIDNIGLTQQADDNWDRSHGTPRKYLRATGRSGNGQNDISISTINGDVVLQQSPQQE
jgi:DUF4097 and DUF4098 domain-containing protein YvlB